MNSSSLQNMSIYHPSSKSNIIKNIYFRPSSCSFLEQATKLFLFRFSKVFVTEWFRQKTFNAWYFVLLKIMFGPCMVHYECATNFFSLRVRHYCQYLFSCLTILANLIVLEPIFHLKILQYVCLHTWVVGLIKNN